MKHRRHVDFILEISYKRLWAISKLKRAGVCDGDILHFFFIKIRSVLESSAPVVHSMLNQEDSEDIDRVQKIVCKVLLEDNYIDYQSACKSLNIESLNDRTINSRISSTSTM